MKKLVLLTLSVVCLSAVDAAAAPITYTGMHGVGPGSVTLSITTNGQIGSLGGGQLLDWVITVDNGTTAFTLSGPGQLIPNSTVSVVGPSLTATASELRFNFSSPPNSYVAFQSPFVGSNGPFYGLQSYNPFAFEGPGEYLSPIAANFPVGHQLSGLVVLASAGSNAPAAVPEPATLTLLATGVGAVAILRRRRQR